MDKETVKRIAEQCDATINWENTYVYFSIEQLQSFAQSVIDNFVSEQNPVAYSAFAYNGNIRIWTSAPDEVKNLAESVGFELKPLYTMENVK